MSEVVPEVRTFNGILWTIDRRRAAHDILHHTTHRQHTV